MKFHKDRTNNNIFFFKLYLLTIKSTASVSRRPPIQVGIRNGKVGIREYYSMGNKQKKYF